MDYRPQRFLSRFLHFLLELLDELLLEFELELLLELFEEFELELFEEFELELPAVAGAAASAPATTRLVAPTAARFKRRSQDDVDFIAFLLLLGSSASGPMIVVRPGETGVRLG